MVGVNKVILIGNLGRDPEIVMFDSIKKASFPLATTEQYKNHDGVKIEETEWHNIVCWRGLADIAEKFLKKSMQVYIEGKLKSRTWEDKDGNKRRTVEVVAENFKILSRSYNQNNSGINNTNEENNIGFTRGSSFVNEDQTKEFNADTFSADADQTIASLSEDNLENNSQTRILPF